MIYTGEFYDISEDKNLYKVVISTETGSQTRTITLGGTPFVTEMDSSDETIYIPAKYQTATVSVIAADYMFDVYSGKAHGTKIELFKNGNIEWVGYTTPNLYNQGFVEDREEFSIECIDGLSTLQYMKYKAAEKTVISFSDLIKKLLSACECYKDFYFALNTMPTGNDYSTFFLDKLSISEDNFFKEKDDNEEDDDVAWTC